MPGATGKWLLIMIFCFLSFRASAQCEIKLGSPGQPLEPVSRAVKKHFGSLAQDTARGKGELFDPVRLDRIAQMRLTFSASRVGKMRLNSAQETGCDSHLSDSSYGALRSPGVSLGYADFLWFGPSLRLWEK